MKRFPLILLPPSARERLRLAIAIAAVAGASSSALGQEPPAAPARLGVPPFAPGEVVVQFKADATVAEKANAFRQGELRVKKHVRTPAMEDLGQPGLTQAATNLPVLTAVKVLSKLPGVEFAEPNWAVSSEAESNDPLYVNGSLWGTYGDDVPSPTGYAGTTNTYGSQAEKAWAADITGEPDVFVGIVDTGIQVTHSDLVENMWKNPGEIPGNSIDDDQNGYVDDVHGWNAVNDNGLVYDAGYDDHGTHVAGTIGAKGGNGAGIAGVNWNVTMISGKFIGREGYGYYVDAIEAIDYMTALRTRKGLNITAINNSWGGGAHSQALFDSIVRAANAGIAFVAAAGNGSSDTDASPFYPAGYDTTDAIGYDSVVSVAGIGKTGLKRVTSNFGLTTVDLGAPGEEILSSVSPNDYAYKNGTSMAAPHVSGAIALYATTHPGVQPWELKSDLLLHGVTATDSLQGITVTGGRLDIGNFLSAPPKDLEAPNAPQEVQAATSTNGRVTLTWLDQSDNESGFAIERSVDGQIFQLADTVGSNISSYSDGTVQPSTTYAYRVSAYNSGGRSDYVDVPYTVTTPAIPLPTAPTGLTGSALPKGGGVSLAWTDRSNNEATFQVERKTGSGSYQLLATVPANTSSYLDKAITARTKYGYRVRAINAAGPSAYTNEVNITAK